MNKEKQMQCSSKKLVRKYHRASWLGGIGIARPCFVCETRPVKPRQVFWQRAVKRFRSRKQRARNHSSDNGANEQRANGQQLTVLATRMSTLLRRLCAEQNYKLPQFRESPVLRGRNGVE